MSAPVNTYNSATRLALGSVPQVADPETYTALLDIHNALEAVLTASDDSDALFQAFMDKYNANKKVTGNYTILPTDGTIEVDATAGAIIITLPLVADSLGLRYEIKRIDAVPANLVTLNGNGTEYIDGHTTGIKISTKSSYTVKANSDENGWNII